MVAADMNVTLPLRLGLDLQSGIQDILTMTCSY